MTSLFPEDLFETPHTWEGASHAPRKLLEDVGQELQEKAKDILGFEIKRRVVVDTQDIFLDFFVTAPTLDDFSLHLLTAQYSVSGVGYPVRIIRWDGKQARPDLEIINFIALRDTVKQFLAHEDTKHMVKCLYFHAKDLDNIC